MALINHRAREIHFKIVYYGPGLGGKTTNLRILHDRLPPERRGKMISIATDHERTLFFDFLPLDLGQVNGFSTRFHLYTVPGQVYYRLSRRAVLQGVDGVVFVADSHPAREQANRESLADLGEHLGTLGLTPAQVTRMPRVFQYNKRDLPGALPVERMHALLNPGGALEFEAVASDGRGVNDTLKAVCKLVLARLTTEPAVESTGAMPILVMRRPGRAQMAQMAADASAAEAAANARSESAAIAAGTMPAPHPPGAPSAERPASGHASALLVDAVPPSVAPATAQAPIARAQMPGAGSAARTAFPPRPIIAPPRPAMPRPMAGPASVARPPSPAPATNAAPVAARPAPPAPAANVAPVAARPAPPAPAADVAPVTARPAPPAPAVSTAPPAAPPASPLRSLFSWSRFRNAAQRRAAPPPPPQVAAHAVPASPIPAPQVAAAPILAAQSAAPPIPAAQAVRAPILAAQAAAPPVPAPQSAARPISAPVAAAPLLLAAQAAARAGSNGTGTAPGSAPAHEAHPGAAHTPFAPAAPPAVVRMVWGRSPRPALRRGYPASAPRPLPPPVGTSRPTPVAPAPPAAEARPPSPGDGPV